MKILVVNAGSSSLKFKLFNLDPIDEASLSQMPPSEALATDPKLMVLLSGVVERVGTPHAQLTYKNHVAQTECHTQAGSLHHQQMPFQLFSMHSLLTPM